VERARASTAPAGGPASQGRRPAAKAGLLRRARKLVERLDPNDDPTAEPLSLVAVLAVLVLSGVSTYLFLRWKIQPMQDLGHHVAMTAVVSDYSRAGSLYPAIYKPFDYLNTNSLLYSVAGLTGKIIGPSWAIRIWAGSYLAFVPLANLYALRVFGRSAWGAVIAVPLAYNMSYVFGFTNFLFAAPLAIVALPLFYRMLDRPSWRRVLPVTVLLAMLFLAHVHVFMWTGVLLFLMTLVGVLLGVRHQVFGPPRPPAVKLAFVALVSTLPAMALFARWMWRSRQPVPDDELSLIAMTSVDWATFKASMPAPSQLLANVYGTMSIVKSEDHAAYLMGLLCTVVICAAIARMHSWKRPPVMELACAITFVSYFCLPENAGGQAVIGSRQIGFAMWFAPAFFTPVPARVSRLGRWFAIVASCWLTVLHLGYWGRLLRRFQREEVNGLEEVLAAAPPKKRMHYVNNQPASSIYPLNTFWHVEKWYMADKLGQCNENPAWGGMNSIRYRKSYDFHRPTNHDASWVGTDEIWDNFEIILTHHWSPTPAQLEMANERGELIKKKGTWQLWRSKRAHPK